MFFVEWVTLPKTNLEHHGTPKLEIWKINFHFKGMMFKFQFLGSNGFLTLQVSGAKDGNDGSDENVAAMDASGAMETTL